MRNKLINFNCERKLIEKVDEFIKKNNLKYKDRTQFIMIAMQEKMEREGHEPNPKGMGL